MTNKARVLIKVFRRLGRNIVHRDPTLLLARKVLKILFASKPDVVLDSLEVPDLPDPPMERPQKRKRKGPPLYERKLRIPADQKRAAHRLARRIAREAAERVDMSKKVKEVEVPLPPIPTLVRVGQNRLSKLVLMPQQGPVARIPKRKPIPPVGDIAIALSSWAFWWEPNSEAKRAIAKKLLSYLRNFWEKVQGPNFRDWSGYSDTRAHNLNVYSW